MQALLDLKSSGGDANAIDILLLQFENNNMVLENADELFESHLHPEHSLKWCKLHIALEFAPFKGMLWVQMAFKKFISIFEYHIVIFKLQ